MGGELLAAVRKRELREHYRELRRRFDPQEKREWDAQILERLTALPEYGQAELLLCYVSMAREPDTYALMRAAWQDGKRVAVPRTVKGRGMVFYEIANHRALVPHSFGIMEPDPLRAVMLDSLEGGLCIVPGLVFDQEGYRLGYGGGYYDRFLEGFSGCSVGICYQACLVDRLEREEHDQPCGLVVSEAGSLRAGG